MTNILFNGHPLTDILIVNLTPHPVHILVASGRLTIDPQEKAARLQSNMVEPRTVFFKGFPIPVFRMDSSGAVGLPAEDPHRILIVSRVVAEKYPHRTDLVFPSDVERDEITGDIVGCRNLSRVCDW